MERPLAFGIEGALEYTGLSKTAFETAQQAGIIVPLLRGTYTKRLLDIAIEKMENEALRRATIKEDKDAKRKVRRATRKESAAPSDGGTQEHLRILRNGT